LPSTEQWQIRQFGNFVIAVQANVAPQVYDLTSSTNFADLAGSPPQARYIDIVGRFVVLSGLLSTPYRVQWSGLNATTTWTSGTNSSDYQDLPDGGIVRGVAGGESGVIFQDRAIRRMTYAPGSPVIFQIERISDDNGLYAPYSLVRSGERIFFYSPKGFHKIEPGGFPMQIGKERVDRTFLADLDTASLQLFIGSGDPKGSRVFWAYKSSNGATGCSTRCLLRLRAGQVRTCFDIGRIPDVDFPARRYAGRARYDLDLDRCRCAGSVRQLCGVGIPGNRILQQRAQARLLSRRQS
jgi:hypothetical protein